MTRNSVADAIEEIWEQYCSSLNSGDLESWLSLWTDDGIQMPPGSPPFIGKDQIRATMKSTLDQVTFSIAIFNEEVTTANGWAYARGKYAATLTSNENGEATPVDGKYMTIFQRQTDGSWKIHRDIFNFNVAPNQE